MSVIRNCACGRGGGTDLEGAALDDGRETGDEVSSRRNVEDASSTKGWDGSVGREGRSAHQQSAEQKYIERFNTIMQLF